MGKSWPFKKAKNDHEAGSSRSKPKKKCNRVYINMDLSWLVYKQCIGGMGRCPPPRRLAPQREEGVGVA
jgi:hypothetical protein